MPQNIFHVYKVMSDIVQSVRINASGCGEKIQLYENT